MSDTEPREFENAPEPPYMTGYAILFMAFLLLAVLKLLDFLDWSWLWITIPIWIAPVAYILSISIAVIAACCSELKNKLNRS